MLHWRLLSPLARALFVAAAALLVAALVLSAARDPIAFLYGAAIILFLAALIVRRRDLADAIARQLQLEADEEEAHRQDRSESPS